ncbi:MAG: tetratricopeptide repeat protein [Candidatus Thorarchaeota archaeon]
MEPFGTITKYYPLLSDETRKAVEKFVENAMTYYEFVNSIVKAATSYPMESEFACFALLQSVPFPDSWQKMCARCSESIATRPFALMRWDQMDPLPKERQGEFHHAMEKAVLSEPFEWMLLALYFYAELVSTEPMRTKYHDARRDLIKTRPTLHRFSDLTYRREAHLQLLEGDIEEALHSFDKAIESASEYDDVINAAVSLSLKANAIKEMDVHRALQLHDEAYSMVADRLTESDATYKFAKNIGLTYELMGEFDLALRFYQKDFELASRLLDYPRSNLAMIVARTFCALNMPQQALEWLQSRSPSLQFEDSLLHSYAANALISLGRYDDAASHLVRANRLAIESGIDYNVAQYLLARGKYEAAHDELDSASSSLQEALELSIPYGQLIVNYALIALAQVEIAGVVKTQVSGLNVQTSGPWMSRLEEHAYERNFHGIRIQHAFLKADYQAKIGEHEAAMQTLNDALRISDSPGVKTLRKRIHERLEELEGVLH